MVVDHVILDAGAAIACNDLPSLGGQFHTTPEVLAEVKDQNARLRLELLPEPVRVREPSEMHVKRVLTAAKASGDFCVLSMADVGIVALALQLMDELGCPAVPRELADKTEMEGTSSGDKPEATEEEEMSAEDADTSEGEDEDEESGWVTKDNLASVLGNGSVVHTSESEKCQVACASTDFAVQNVCARLGIPILSCQGRLISEIRTHVLWCAGCYKRCLRPDRRFCPSCGHATLQRISAQLDNATGQLRLFFKKNYQYRLKGTRYSLPRPRGGKHSLDPVVCEWQRVPQQRPSKKTLHKANPFAAEAECGPASGQLFAQHDLSSRAAVLGIRGGLPHWSRRNPNESARRTGSGRKSRRK